jgi:hypothetical protein
MISMNKNTILLKYSVLFFITIFLFAWDMFIYEYQFKIKYLGVVLVPFFINKNLFFSNSRILLLFLIIVLHKFVTGYYLNLEYNYSDVLEILIFIMLSILFIQNFNHFINYYKQIILICSIILIIYFIAFIIINEIYLPDDIIGSCYENFISKNNFIFMEGSHFGFSFIGIFLYSIYLIFYKNISNIRKVIFILSSAIIFLNYSTSFLISCVVMSLIIILYLTLKKEKILPFFLIFLFSSSILYFDKQCNARMLSALKIIDDTVLYKFFIKKDTQKIDVIQESHNLSSVIYVNSFFNSKEIITKHQFGVGFNNLHFFYKEASIKNKNKFNKSYWNFIINLNNNDGSNNFVKMFSEFGYIFFIFFYLIIKFILNKNIAIELKLFILSPLIEQIFFRGAGYFNGGFLFYVLFIIKLNNIKKINA